MLNYFAEVIEDVPTKPGCWNYQKIGVFRKLPDGGKEKIGEYQRDYSSFMGTFCPFRLKDRDFALYSPNYTGTRIMELPGCKDIGGEEPDSMGFCPTGYYVPTFEILQMDIKGEKHKYSIVDPDEVSPQSEIVQTEQSMPFGFVAGCIWGDDSSWKIEYLDLSEADKGILKRTGRFGYIELPAKLELKDAIHIYADDDGKPLSLRIDTTNSFDLKTGKRKEWGLE